MSRRTIKLPEEDWKEHNERRKQMGLTWSEYIDGQSVDLEPILRRVIRDELNNE